MYLVSNSCLVHLGGEWGYNEILVHLNKATALPVKHLFLRNVAECWGSTNPL